jgi:hypothetical protein
MMDYSWLDLYPLATVVTVWRGFYEHSGLLTEAIPGYERNVISLNPGPVDAQVREEPVSVFARGKEVFVRETPHVLRPNVVLARARSGQHPLYSLISFNCDHYWRFAHGVKPDSPQLRTWASIGLVGLLVWGFSKSG